MTNDDIRTPGRPSGSGDSTGAWLRWGDVDRTGSALRRRYEAARDSIGMWPLRWHDLRHTFGSLLVSL
jgi:integrase